MSRQIQARTAPLWTLAGFALVMLSFAFTSFILGNAVNAVVHLIDALVDFLQTHTPFLDTYEHRLFAH